MNFFPIFRRNFKRTIRDLPCSVTINGTVYKGTRTNITNGEALEVEGVVVEESAYVVFLLSDFTTLPEIENKCTIDGVQYRIKNLDTSQDGVTLTISFENLR